MSKLLITGDAHGQIDIGKLTTKRFPFQKELTKDDVLIVLGDWGAIWYGNQKDNYMLKWWEDKPWTTFVILGNHENYSAIEQLSSDTAFGAPVRRVSDSIVIAETGNVYTICGKKCLVLNGADSHDMWCRKEGLNWWKQESITQDAANKALISLAQNNDEIDYFFTHTCGGVGTLSCGFKPSNSDRWVDFVMNHLPADGDWEHYCGHMHIDVRINDKTRILYQDVILLHDTESDTDEGLCINTFKEFYLNEEVLSKGEITNE